MRINLKTCTAAFCLSRSLLHSKTHQVSVKWENQGHDNDNNNVFSFTVVAIFSHTVPSKNKLIVSTRNRTQVCRSNATDSKTVALTFQRRQEIKQGDFDRGSQTRESNSVRSWSLGVSQILLRHERPSYYFHPFIIKYLAACLPARSLARLSASQPAESYVCLPFLPIRSLRRRPRNSLFSFFFFYCCRIQNAFRNLHWGST